MNDFYYRLLNALYKKHRSLDYLKKKFKRIRPDRLTDAIEYLEENLLIEEATSPELIALDNGLPLSDVCSSDFVGVYYITEIGRQAVEEWQEDNIRFYLPFVVTTAISLLSLVISVVSLLLASY